MQYLIGLSPVIYPLRYSQKKETLGNSCRGALKRLNAIERIEALEELRLGWSKR